MPEPVIAIVVAAGSGTRMGVGEPKPLRQLQGKALVALSVEALAAGGCTHAVIVSSPTLRPRFHLALSGAPIPVRFVDGGQDRQDSVHNGLRAVLADPELARATVVLIHDSVRPLVPTSVVESVIAAVRAGEVAVIPTIPVFDSIRELLPTGSRPVDRSRLRAVQTPQGFDLATLAAAHDYIAAHGIQVTDDATACEALGHRVTLVEGSRHSIKVTEPMDMMIAETLAEMWRNRR